MSDTPQPKRTPPFPGIYLIGLTGNIACGKSAVLSMLQELGAHVIDADRVTHQLQQPGEPVYTQIVAAFGTGILIEPDGPIDRQALGKIVFSDPPALHQLEQIIHPAVHAVMIAWLQDVAQQTDAPTSQALGQHFRVAVIDAIKLLESGWKSLCDTIWVVTCPPAQQRERLMVTRGMSAAEADTRIAAQPPQAEKIAQADLVIDNSGTLEETRRQVVAAWQAIRA